MFSPIALMALNHIATTDEETPTTASECSEEIPTSIPNKPRLEPSSDPFLSVLDDKNRTITVLKKQLQNQKLQLTFYIQRELNKTKIEELSESCTPQASEESLPLNLAINKFCRQAGIKTKLSLLHEHMTRLDYKITNLLRDQEFVLRKIVNKLCEFVKCQEVSRYANFKAEFGHFITDPLHVDLFDKLLGATVGLTRKLNTFKICCDRVLLVEEERNAIVEQVYSMPVEERINRNYLVGIQMEKAELENEIRRISRHQAASSNRIKELNAIENILNNLQWELNSSFLNNEESCINSMVKKINSEARVLLEMTKEKKRRFECEISKTKCPNSDRILFYIKMAADFDKMDKNEMERSGIKTEDEVRFFDMVKGEISILKNKIRQEAEHDNRILKEEGEQLKNKITQVLLENSRTKVNNETLKQELEEIKVERKKGLQKLKEERDAYKAQVEDLQAIREAYAQLVDRQPNTSTMEREFFEQIDDRDRKILGLQNQLMGHNHEMEKLKEKVSDQNDQIAVLKRFINLTRPNSPRVNENFKKETESTSNDPCCSKDTCQNAAVDILTQLKIKTKHEGEPIEVENDVRKSKLRGFSIKKPGKTNARNQQGVISTSKKKSNKNKIPKIKDTSFKSHSQKSLTCMKISSHTNGNTNGTADIVKTVVTTNEEINGNVKMETASVFSMEIKYTNGEADEQTLEYNEFELYKDCSAESFVLENRYGRSTSKMQTVLSKFK